MSLLGATLALACASPSVRVSVDRAYLPAGAGDSAPVAHLAVRGAREVEVSLYEVAHPAQALLGVPGPSDETELEPPPLAVSAASLRRRARDGYTALWRSLRPTARELVKELLGLDKPVGASLLSPPAGSESRVRRGEKLLRSWRLPTGEPGWNYADLELGPVPSGLYRVEALATEEADGRSRPSIASSRALLTVSRLSLLALRTSEGSSILATDAVDGRPLPGVELFGKAALGRTGPGGLWSTRTPLEGLVAGRLEGQLARVTLPPPRAEPVERAAAAVFFDRRAYRPGEEVRVWCLLRSREGGIWKIPEAEDAELQLLDRGGTVLFAEPAEVSALGVVSRGLELPEGLPPGWYTLAVGWSGERRAGELLVQSEAPAELTAHWEGPPWSPPSAPLDVALLLQDRLGKPVPGSAVHWIAEARAAGSATDDASAGPSELIGEGAGVSRADGRVAMRLPPALGEGGVALHAEAEDSAGRSAVADLDLRRSQIPATLELSPERRVLRPGRASSVGLEGRTLEGQPWHGRVDVRVREVHSSPGGDAVRSDLLEKAVDLDAHGRASLALPAVPAGYLEARATLPGTDQPLARTSIFVTENGGDIPTTPDRLELILDRREYGRGDEVRLLVLTPFEAGTVLLGVEPSAGPPDQLVPIHGYSGVAHLKAPAATAARLTAAALAGGTLYRASVPLPLPSPAPPLALRLSPERPLVAGQRVTFAVVVTDAGGHGVPAQLQLSAATSPPAAPGLGQLFLPGAPPAAVLASSSGADDSAAANRGPGATPRALQPFGPFQLADPAWEREAAVSQTAELSADDLGHASWSLHVPADASVLYVTARGVGGPDLFGERSWVLPVAPAPRLSLDAPRWVRALDQFEVRASAQEAGAVACPLPLELTGGHGLQTVCSDGGMERSIEAGPGPALELAVALPAPKLALRRTVAVAAPPAAAAATAGELARALAQGLAGPAESADPVELDCAAVRALGALRAADRSGPTGREAVSTVARIAVEQNPSGGFGAPEGELPRDLAALRGLVALRGAGTSVDAGFLSRLQHRVEALAGNLPDADERERLQAVLESLRATPRRRAGRPPSADPGPAAEGSPGQIADWIAGHRPKPAAALQLAAKLAQAAAQAGPLEAAEIAAALAALDPRTPALPPAGPPAVSRRYLAIDREPWTEAMLAAGEEPGEPTQHASQGPIPLGSEVEVALSVQASPGASVACVRDFPPAGFAAQGAPQVSEAGLLVCGPTSHDRLEVSYLARAVRRGRFQAPAAGPGVSAPPGLPAWVEVAP